MGELNKDVIKKFWKLQTSKPSNRWTGKELLNFEINYLNEIRSNLPDNINILDLGSGAGILSRNIQKSGDTLTAVDFESDYNRFFLQSKKQKFIAMDVTDFKSEIKFDLILVHGVVTYLSKEEEGTLYRNILGLMGTGGTAVIKNQIGLEQEIIINLYSNDLEAEYSARYPFRNGQEHDLIFYFGDIKTILYPERFNKFKETAHVAFLVSNFVV